MHYDVAVIGGGIAGLSAAAWLAPRCSVVVVEAEDTLGYHATGRSAASFTECSGPLMIRRLVQASRSYLVSADGITSAQPVMFVAPPGRAERVDELFMDSSRLVPTLQRLSPSEVVELCSAFDTGATAGGMLEPEAMSLDVHALLMEFVTTVRDGGGTIVNGFRATDIARTGGRWHLRDGNSEMTADIVVNAAGAWGDTVAAAAGAAPLGLQPLLRSVFTFTTDHDTTTWPLVVDVDEGWYFRPEGPQVLGSAASELLSAPIDAKAPELDVALGIEKVNEATNLAVRSVRNTWAGLRTFTHDKIPAVGFDTETEGFFWLVGQGGYGIKTSPAIGELAAALVLGDDMPSHIADHGITSKTLSPKRLR